jgi:hypothetical protein
MGLFRRQIMTIPLLSFLSRPSDAQRAGSPELPNYPRRGEPLPPIPPLRRDVNGDRTRNLKDLALLAEIVQNLKEMIDKNDPVVVSVPLLKKADEMRTLAQKIQGRLRSDYGK